jgi:hypothetical protein
LDTTFSHEHSFRAQEQLAPLRPAIKGHFTWQPAVIRTYLALLSPHGWPIRHRETMSPDSGNSSLQQRHQQPEGQANNR